jgi:hypothetical protein
VNPWRLALEAKLARAQLKARYNRKAQESEQARSQLK